MENDFPIISQEPYGGSPYRELTDDQKKNLTRPSTIPEGGFEKFKEKYGIGKDPKGFLAGFMRNSFSATGQPGYDESLSYSQQLNGTLGPMNVNYEVAGPSFDLAPDIDSPIIDQWVKEKGGPKPNMLNPNSPEFYKRINEIRRSLGKGPIRMV